MAEDEIQGEGQIQDEPEVQPTAENTPDEGGEASPAPQVEDWQSKLASYEDRIARQEERSRYLEQTNRLLEESLRSNRQPAHREQEISLSPELEQVDRTLDPVFNKRLKSHIDPLNETVSSLMDGNDALRFEMYLSRTHPDILDNEEALNRVYQQVEQIRRQAANVYGKSLTRVDAFLYAQGLEGVKEKSKARTTKKSTQVKEEAKRQLQVQAARSGEGTPEQRRPAGAAGIESIMKRMRAGERTTPEERAKVKEYLRDAQF